MNKEKFQQLMLSPDTIEDQDFVQLQEVVRDYPYFHNAHLLLLYCLRQQKPDSFDEQLRQSSLHLSSRTDLLKAMIQGWPSYSPPATESRAQEIILSPEIENAIPDIEADEKEIEVETDALKESAQPREFSFEENFSFSLDEDTQQIEAIETKEDEVNEKQGLPSDLLDFDLNSPKQEEDPREDLIDYFLKVNPRIVPKLDFEDKRGDISIPGLEENDEIVTETLADIYEQQGHYLKAKEAYQKLILKFPEKSTYFARRIQELEKLIK